MNPKGVCGPGDGGARRAPVRPEHPQGHGRVPAPRSARVAAPAHSSVLDLAPGPGYLANLLARDHGHRVTGLDMSETFVGIASRMLRRRAWMSASGAFGFARVAFNDRVACVSTGPDLMLFDAATGSAGRFRLPGASEKSWLTPHASPGGAEVWVLDREQYRLDRYALPL